MRRHCDAGGARLSDFKTTFRRPRAAGGMRGVPRRKMRRGQAALPSLPQKLTNRTSRDH
ncbi:uncharacterized protein SCHCODRAFT_02115864 [Schizophyllum commune H4-8]|uniref:uncharacterized protein n=1 Tax=Schizophyllum commune (strain H4-8 / FGSC 9210) TaxID=578458 RepID=UPI0021606AB7|nr:uncharacterized protein SCHCODRAFT_02115864 [Schizophyllum commune H4-8]KAI5886190.1 hypothetical protein SCHCODRAFT_02115864 [Schizophyllum commune H4-8]